jgi:translocation and assembly module TamA
MLTRPPARLPSASTRWRLPLACVLMLASAAHANIDIDIPDVTDVVANNVQAFLSLTRYKGRDDVSPETMTRLERRIAPEVRQALEPLGYYAPTISHEVRRESEKHWRVIIRIVPGRPVRLSEVKIEITGAGKDEPALANILARRELKPGLRLNHGRYDRVKGDLLRAAANHGYLDARYVQSDLLIDPKERRASAALKLDTGERYYFGAINTIQDAIDERAMRRLLRMQEGDPYTLDALLRTQYVLDDTQYFGNTEIESGERDSKTHTVPVTVRAATNRRNRYGVSVGYATDTRARGRFTWDDRIVNRSGHRFQTELIGSELVQEVTLRYAIPVMDVALEKLEFSLSGKDEDLGDVTSRRVEFTAGLTQVVGKWQRVLFTRLSRETSKSGSRGTVNEDGDSTFQNNTDFYIIPGISFSTMPPYLVGELTRQYSVFAELTGSPNSLGSDASYLRLRVEAERVFDLNAKWHLRLRGNLGASWVAEAFELPASQRFFAGGDRSVRGFGLNELPIVEGENTGRKHMLTGTVEIERDLPRNFRVAAFSDAGNAFDDFFDEPVEYSVGLGLRYQIAVASFGVDVAQALSESGRNPRLHLHFSTVF